MTIDQLKTKTVGILGFGKKEGRATAEFLVANDIHPILYDQRPWENWPEEDREYIQKLGLRHTFGPNFWDDMEPVEVLFRNPAVPRLHPKLLQLEKNGATVTSQTIWFFDHCPATIIGVTGTKGKGTTSSLIYESLKAATQSSKPRPFTEVYLTGNIGGVQPFELLGQLTLSDIIVYELSSFQLQDLKKSPHIGVILMTTADHLDHHTSLQEYHGAKESIVAFQNVNDFAIVNTDYEASKKIGEKGLGKKRYVSRFHETAAGCFVGNRDIILRSPGQADEIIGHISEVRLKGAHNLENICAAAAAAHCAGVDTECIRKGLFGFTGLPHRLEYVATKNGSMFYNDSISTNPDTAIAALEAFNEEKILIVGGAKKNLDFSRLADRIATTPSVIGIVVVGEEGPVIGSMVAERGYAPSNIYFGGDTMEKIVKTAAAIAKPGSVVLLSPGCTSFDMFANYQDRGNKFKQAVLSL